jgi:dihydrofolate reductase
MKIRVRMCTSADGYISTPDGWPAQLAHPEFDPESFGFVEFQAGCDAVLMGRTTFEPAIQADQWPWADVAVFVLGSHTPAGTPEHVIVDDDPARLLDEVRAANQGGDVHLVGGPRTIETFRALGAVDELGLIVLPLLLGGGKQLTPSLSVDAGLAFSQERTLPGGAVELVYDID